MTRRPAFNVAMWALLLVICASALFATLRQPPIWTLEIGARGDEQFIAGFFEVERGEGAVFRWSGPGAQLRLHGADVAPSVLQLRLHTDERAVQKGQGVQLSRADQPFATFQLQPGWRVYETLVRAGSGGETPALGVDTTVELPPVRGRALGVALDTLRVVPLQPAVVAPLVRALLLTWWVALLAALLWRVLSIDFLERRFAGRWLSTVRTLLVGASIVAAAALLVRWAQRDPHGLARALPPMPWVQGLATLALLVVGVRGQESGVRSQATRTQGHKDTKVHSAVRGSRFAVLGSCLVLVFAQVLLTTQTAVALGLGLALAALAALVYAGALSSEDSSARADVTPRTAALLLGGIVVVALGLRFYRLGDLPYGLWRDEAEHGLAALRILEDPSYRPIYIADTHVNMPALGLYPFALAIKLWGIHAWSMRPVTALAGALTVLPLYGLVLRLWQRRDLALLAAALLAVSSWHITISRFSFPTIFDPLLALTGLWLMMVGVGVWGLGVWGLGIGGDAAARSPQPAARSPQSLVLGSWFFAGVCFALALQTYHTGRVVPVVGAVLALLLLWRNATQWRRWLLGAVAALLGFALVASPLISYALNRPSAFGARTSAVFLLSEDALHGQAPLTALEDSIGKHLLMFNVRGDENGRHANPGHAMLDFVTGLGFLLGLAALLQRWRDWRSIFVLAALAISLLPSLLSVDSPHGMRAIGGAAFACVIAAVGWVSLLSGVRRQASAIGTAGADRTPVVRRSSFVGVVGVALALNSWIYFVQMPASPEVWQSFYPVHTQAGTFVRDLAAQDGAQMPQIFVRSNIESNAVFEYLAHDLPVQQLSDKTPADAVKPDALFILSGYSYQRDFKRLASYVSASDKPVLVGPLFPDGVTPSFVVYRRDK